MAMKTLLIPMGMRCNAAIVTNSIVNQPRLPFDWAQIDIDSMIQCLEISKEDIELFWTEYFNQVDSSHHHLTTNSWFPHDNFDTEENKIQTIKKYVRRHQRLLALLEQESHKIYVIFFGFPIPETSSFYTLYQSAKLIESITKVSKGTNTFVVCNAKKNEEKTENIHFIYERLEETVEGDSWDILTKKIEARIRQFLLSQQTEPTPFE